MRLMIMAACLSMAGCGGEAPIDEPAEQPPAEQPPARTEPIRSDFSRATAADTASAQVDADTAEACHPSYPDFCLPPPPPDLNCADIKGKKPFSVRHNVANPDPHAFDRDGDGKACEPNPRRRRGK